MVDYVGGNCTFGFNSVVAEVVEGKMMLDDMQSGDPSFRKP